jgi:hypothetical protein
MIVDIITILMIKLARSAIANYVYHALAEMKGKFYIHLYIYLKLIR